LHENDVRNENGYNDRSYGSFPWNLTQIFRREDRRRIGNISGPFFPIGIPTTDLLHVEI
jgi:hypothetical protein